MKYEKPEMIVKLWKDGDVFTDTVIASNQLGAGENTPAPGEF